MNPQDLFFTGAISFLFGYLVMPSLTAGLLDFRRQPK